ncbi:patellin-3 isoform X1 [Sorghum bicolor]|uniref:patellin-3 isoform X1 n=1 Tax=Sorghum bicolor TaxID=4558 RepID=UPI000B423FE2|nr:patellin-3 isoform X1 [Sorghum bicolor]|eukprot:XP_021303626.1 patellin-3 isoform X1 [Sorghum bicolor]
MADETKPKAAAPAAEVAVTEADNKAEEPAPVAAEEKAVEVAADEKAVEAAAEEEKKAEEAEEAAAAGDEAAVIDGTGSFKEESNLVSELPNLERTALAQLKELVAAALANGEFNLPPPPPPPAAKVEPAKKEEPTMEEAKEEAPAAAKEDEPKAEEAVAEEPVKEEAKPEEPKTEAPAEVAAAEEAKDEAPAPEEPKTKAPAPEEPKTEAPAPEEPAKEEPKAEAAAEAVAEEPKAEAATEETKPAEPEPEEKTVVVAEEEATKTVEAIEETVAAATAVEPEAESALAQVAEPKEELIWGVPLVGDDERTDTVLLKFLRAREFKVKEALAMLKSAVLWRKRFGIDEVLGADLGLPELENVVFYRGADREGHPVCYNVYGEFQDKELYEKAFGDEEKRERFLKWRIQLLERGIREQLDFSPSGICSMVQVTDLKNSPPMLGKHRAVTRQALALLQDNYPEFVAKKIIDQLQVFINVPWWYLAANKVMSPFLTQRTKSKIVFCSPGKSAETLFRYIAPEQVPVQFGGLYKEDDTEFSTSDAVTELTVKPSSKETIEIPATENSTVVWELRVLGWEVSYGAEFTPDAEGGYTVIVQKTRKVPAHEEPIMKGSFKVTEPGKVVLAVNNPASTKKKLLYRFKVKSTAESAAA